MGIFVAVLVIGAIIAVAFLALRSNSKHTRTRKHSTGKQKAVPASPARPGGIDKLKNNPDFWGVQIGQAGCQAARDIMDNSYPMDEAPVLPLDGCDAAMCTCIFKGLPNHRKMHRRTHESRRSEHRFEEGKSADRRSRKDRRRGNNWDDRSY